MLLTDVLAMAHTRTHTHTPTPTPHPPPSRHVWFCKTRHVSVLEHGMFLNHMTHVGVTIEILVLLLVVFVPGLNSVMLTASFPGPVWAVSLIYLVYIATVSEWLKRMAREQPQGWISQNLVW